MEIDPNEGWRVGKAELRIRFGCGAIAGLVFGGLIAFEYYMGNLWIAVPIAIVAAIATGIAATKHGDSFWKEVLERIWWLWPTP